MKLSLLIILLLSSCDKMTTLQRIQEQYPLCEVRELPGNDWFYVMRDECNSVWYVEVYSTGTIVAVELIK